MAETYSVGDGMKIGRDTDVVLRKAVTGLLLAVTHSAFGTEVVVPINAPNALAVSKEVFGFDGNALPHQ
jgi:hypothetical protein